MAVGIVLLIVVIASVLFNFVSPWWFTPIASNWGTIDDATLITFIITGVVAVAVMLFVCYAVFRFRHREGQKADYEPENPKLEWWLTIATAVGVVAILAPGLFVWYDYVTVPEDAAEVEVLGQQWMWTYRFPGEDGKLGTVDTKNVSYDNPFGMNPDDPNGRDDILVESDELHLPLGQPVKMLLRSIDVLHDFYVPQFRAKMDLVPGLVSYFWFTPTRTGQFEVLCAELCGVGHHVMRGSVVVEEEAEFAAWLSDQPTYAEFLAAAETGNATDLAMAEDAGTSGEK